VTTIHRYAVRLKSTASRIVSRVPFLFMQLSSVVEREQTGPTSLAADYGLYGWVVEGKFSTSQIQLVLLDLRWCLGSHYPWWIHGLLACASSLLDCSMPV
jgi:hypothetical protein